MAGALRVLTLGVAEVRGLIVSGIGLTEQRLVERAFCGGVACSGTGVAVHEFALRVVCGLRATHVARP